MKALKSILIATLMIAFSMNVSFAGEGEAEEAAAERASISKQITTQIGVPVLDIEGKKTSLVLLSFSVNADNELEVKNVESEHLEIVDYFNEKLEGFELENLGGNHVGQIYRMQVLMDIQ